jgi:hypothetical protein
VSGDLTGLVRALEQEQYGEASHIARAEAGRAGRGFEQAILHAVAAYADAMDEWMVAYGNDQVGAKLAEAQKTLCLFARRAGRDRLTQAERDFIRVCKAVNLSTAAHVEIENAEVCSDATRLLQCAQRAWAALAAVPLLATSGPLGPLAEFLNDQVADDRVLLAAMADYADVVRRRDDLSCAEFAEAASRAEGSIATAARRLRDAILSTTTHLAMQRRFLALHSRVAAEECGQLRLIDAQVVNFVSWKMPEWAVGRLADALAEPDGPQRVLGPWAGPMARPRPLDLYRTPEGDRRVGVHAIPCGTARLRLWGQVCDARVTLKLHRFGVCSVHFAFSFPDASVSRVRECQSLMAPYAARRLVEWEGPPAATLCEIAERIASAVRIGIRATGEDVDDRDWAWLPHLTWFSHVWAPRWVVRHAGEDQEVAGLGDVAEHPDLSGLVLGPREARATIEDWRAAPRPRLDNLAPIRSHAGDLMHVGEHHAVLFYPDDPYYLVEQFVDTVELAAKLRCLAVALNYQAQSRVPDVYHEAKRLREELAAIAAWPDAGAPLSPEARLDSVLDAIERHRLKATAFRDQTLRSLDLIAVSSFAQYSDHAEQTRETLRAAGVPRVVSAIEKTLDMLRADLDTIATAAGFAVDRARARRDRAQAEEDRLRAQAEQERQEEEKKRERSAQRRGVVVGNLLAVLAFIQAISFIDLKYKDWNEGKAGILELMVWSLLVLFMVFVVLWGTRPLRQIREAEVSGGRNRGGSRQAPGRDAIDRLPG